MSLPAPTAAALGALERFGVRLGLETIRRLLTELGEPQRRFPAVLVAGTNGKGSTSALLASMLGAAGYRTGLYTSPHLEDVEERCRIDGVAVDGERLGAAVEAVLAAARTLPSPPTYFEALTAAAFLLFAEDRLDLAVLEVGLGGRLDATNAAELLLSVIAPIAFDHREHLGSTLAAIAREKAGILRAGRPAVVWQEAPEAAETVRAVAAGLGTPLRFANLDTTELCALPNGLAGQQVRLRGRELDGELALRLLGAHQARNLALA
ncbi:MAG: bifunctional folylpolyglutamate synthase/dihydrofolate synthase, partial [Acidobacteriota bacterium]